jgi:serine/threonine protein kinase
MGNCDCKNQEDVIQDSIKPIDKISNKNFEFIHVIGRGGFGKVWKVKFKKDGSFLAMKEMLKARILSRRSLKSVMAEM